MWAMLKDNPDQNQEVTQTSEIFPENFCQNRNGNSGRKFKLPSNFDLEHFWSKVDKSESQTECWIWNGSRRKGGYGDYRGVVAHRISYYLSNGQIPDLGGYHGGCVCHSCDVRECVNPLHLFIGSQRSNLKDMAEKERAVYCRKVLSDSEAEEVRQLRKDGMKYQDIANKFGMAIGSIHEIVNGRNKKPKKENGRREYRSLLETPVEGEPKHRVGRPKDSEHHQAKRGRPRKYAEDAPQSFTDLRKYLETLVLDISLTDTEKMRLIQDMFVS